MMHHQILGSNTRGKNKKVLMKTINLSFQDQHGIKDLNYLTDHIL